MAIITANSIYKLSPFGGEAVFGTYVRGWKNTLIGFAYMDSTPLVAQIIVLNAAMNEQLGSTITAGDGSWTINTIPKRYENSPLVVVMVPIGSSTASPQIKTGIYPY